MAEKRARGGGCGRVRWRERAASAVVDKAFGCDGGAIYTKILNISPSPSWVFFEH